jgi:chromosome segregation ATPase
MHDADSVLNAEVEERYKKARLAILDKINGIIGRNNRIQDEADLKTESESRKRAEEELNREIETHKSNIELLGLDLEATSGELRQCKEQLSRESDLAKSLRTELEIKKNLENEWSDEKLKLLAKLSQADELTKSLRENSDEKDTKLVRISEELETKKKLENEWSEQRLKLQTEVARLQKEFSEASGQLDKHKVVFLKFKTIVSEDKARIKSLETQNESLEKG